MARWTLALLGVLGIASVARSEFVTFEFRGKVKDYSKAASALFSVSGGTPIAGTVTYDPLAPAFHPFKPAGSMTFQVAGRTFTSDPTQPLTVGLSHEGPSPTSGASASGNYEGLEIFTRSLSEKGPGGPTGVHSSLGLLFFTRTPSLTDRLPADLDGYFTETLSASAFWFGPPGSQLFVASDLTVVRRLNPQSAPEPGTLALAAAGAGLALLARRRGQRHQGFSPRHARRQSSG